MDARRSLLPAHAAGLVVLASVAAADPGGWYPFVVAKFSAVSLAVVWCWWVAVRERTGALDRRAFWAFSVLVALLAVAALAGRDPYYAWTGTPERHLGVLTWLLFFAAFATGSRLADPFRRARFVRWVVASGVALGLYTLVERWHPLIETANNSVRLGGPYGSASFLGAALCLTLPVSVAATLGDDRAGWRLAGALSAALGTAALVGSGTRAAWLALGAGAVLVAVARLAPWRTGTPRSRGRARVAWSSRPVLPVGAVLLGVVVALGTSSAVATRTRGASSRLDEWGLGLRIVAHHPSLGVGPEGYRTALADGVTASYERAYGRTVLPDRAHNVLIDVAAAGGVPAAIVYLALVALIGVAAWQVFRRGTTLEIGLAASAVVYLVQQCFLFPVATIDPVFWIIAGMLVVAPGHPSERTSRRWVGAVAVPALLVLFAVGVVSVAADRAARDAVETRGVAAAQRAVTLRPDVARYRLLVAETLPRTIAGYDAAIASIERAHAITPHDPIVEQRLADAFTKRAIATGTADDQERALDAWQRLADSDPYCYPCHIGLGYAAALSGDVPRAITAFEVAAGLEPAGTTEAADAVRGLSEITEQSGTDADG